MTVKTPAPIILLPGSVGPVAGDHPSTLIEYYETGFGFVCLRPCLMWADISTTGKTCCPTDAGERLPDEGPIILKPPDRFPFGHGFGPSDLLAWAVPP
jgi:hypothetical protein